jgi:predicted alpha/beta superfamily hydrolase
MSVRKTVIVTSLLTVFAIALGGIRPAQAQESDTQALTFGHATTVYSRVLGEERTILVDVPAGYDLTQTRFPVLYVLDGIANFHHAAATVDFLSRNGRIPQMIVVAIANNARTRDLTPTHIDDRPTSGGGDAFLQFVEEELIPFVDDRYRTQPYRVLFGHSLGGMFAVYTLFKRPDAFGGYIAASPHLQYDDDRVVAVAEEILAGNPAFNKSLYITLGDEPDYVETLERFTSVLEGSGDTGLRWEYARMENEEHMTTPLKSVYQGLEMLFVNWRYPGELAEADVSQIQKHYEALSEEMGYEILIPEGLMNQLGYLLLSEERYDEAVVAFKLNIENYPGSANVYDSLGEAYEAMNELAMAKVNYEKAYQRGLEIDDRNTMIYKRHLDDLLQKLSDFD